MKILAYHQVVRGQPPNIHAVTEQAFTVQMAWLSENGYQVITVEDHVAQLAAGRRSNVRTVAITFDDGYRDNFTTAWPVLERHEFPATIFLVAGSVGGHRNWGKDPGHGEPLLSWEDLHYLQDHGINFGSHSCTHPVLTNLPLEKALREIVDSRAVLEKGLGQAVRAFCYPHGAVNAQVEAIVRSAGFDLACTIRPHYVGAAGFEPFRFQRIGVLASDTLDTFSSKVRGAMAYRVRWYRYWGRSNLGRLHRSVSGKAGQAA